MSENCLSVGDFARVVPLGQRGAVLPESLMMMFTTWKYGSPPSGTPPPGWKWIQSGAGTRSEKFKAVRTTVVAPLPAPEDRPSVVPLAPKPKSPWYASPLVIGGAALGVGGIVYLVAKK